MAKKKSKKATEDVKEKEVIIVEEEKEVEPKKEVEETVEEKVVEEKPEIEKAEISEPIIVESKDRKVKIIPMKNLSNIFIGGTYYNFKKNVDQRVPPDVERILRERDLIK